jgi:soluble lytic murein transglycosylase-like protein
MLSTLALLAALTLSPHELLVRQAAAAMDVDPDYAACIVARESEFDPAAVGDQGRARGLWQFHLPSWVHVRTAMGASVEDRRDNPVEATVTALYAIKHLNLAHWWTADQFCRPEAQE